jgi:periplasmic protein TonB
MRQALHNSRFILILVLLLTTQQTFSQDKKDSSDIVFEKVEIEASFPGGDAAWTKYVYNAFKNVDFDTWKNSDQGTCRIRFIVDKKGNISEVKAMNMKRTRLAKFAVEVIENGPRWSPAMQKGKPVNAYREQPITFSFQKEKK